MESVVSRSGWWLAALFLSIFAMAAAVDWGFSVHMGIFALAALVGLVVSLRTTDFQAARAGS